MKYFTKMHILFFFLFILTSQQLLGQNSPKDSLSNFVITYQSDKNTWNIKPNYSSQKIDYQYLLEYPEMRAYGIGLEKFAFTPQFTFKDSLEIKAAVSLKIAPFEAGIQIGKEIYFDLKNHRALGLPIQVLQNERWEKTEKLSDGVLGSLHCELNVWQLFSGKENSIYLDLEDKITPQNISFSFFTNLKKEIILPKTVEYYTSDDGENWDFAWVNSFEDAAIPQNPAIFKSVWELSKESSFQYLMIVLVGDKNKKITKSTFYVDEILVK
jgi:hypothetical protein